jgi:hypothetical protein
MSALAHGPLSHGEVFGIGWGVPWHYQIYGKNCTILFSSKSTETKLSCLKNYQNGAKTAL